MGVFTDIELAWRGSVYTIKAHRVMGALSRIEDVFTLPELQGYFARGTYPLAKLCTAYAAVLRYAGARVTDDEIYETAFSGAGEQEAVIVGVTAIMKMMLPASVREKMYSAPDDAKPGADLGNSRAARASSKKPSKRPSRKANG